MHKTLNPKEATLKAHRLLFHSKIQMLWYQPRGLFHLTVIRCQGARMWVSTVQTTAPAKATSLHVQGAHQSTQDTLIAFNNSHKCKPQTCQLIAVVCQRSWAWGSFKTWSMKYTSLKANMITSVFKTGCRMKPWKSICILSWTKDTA